MNTAKRKGASRLGRGLDALLSPTTAEDSVRNSDHVEINNSSVDTLDLTVCDLHNWDGINYTTSGYYTNVYVDYNGCEFI